MQPRESVSFREPVNLTRDLNHLSSVVETELAKGTQGNFDKMCDAIFQILIVLNRLSHKSDHHHNREVSKEMILNVNDQVKLKKGLTPKIATAVSVLVQGIATGFAFSPAYSAVSTPLSYLGQSVDKVNSVHSEHKNGESIDLQHKKDEMSRLQNDQREAMQRAISRISEFMQSLRQIENTRHESIRTAASAA